MQHSSVCTTNVEPCVNYILFSVSSENSRMIWLLAKTSTGLSETQVYTCTNMNPSIFLLTHKKGAATFITGHSFIHTPDSAV